MLLVDIKICILYIRSYLYLNWGRYGGAGWGGGGGGGEGCGGGRDTVLKHDQSQTHLTKYDRSR